MSQLPNLVLNDSVTKHWADKNKILLNMESRDHQKRKTHIIPK